MTGNFDISKRMYDSSCISDYMGCPRLFYYVWIRRLKPKEVDPSLNFGSVWHEVMLEWYKLRKEGKNVEVSAGEASKLFSQLPSGITADHKTQGWGEAIFKEYIERYPDEPGKTLHLEKEFRVEIGGKLYGGRIDRIEDWNGQIYIDDHKTSARLGASFFDRFRPHVQMDGYCFACKEVCGACQGAIINGISTAKNPKDRFQRFPSSRTEWELENFKTIFTDWTDRIEGDVAREYYPMKTNYCTYWGRKCKFWELCVYGEMEEYREKYIAQNFVVDEVKR